MIFHLLDEKLGEELTHNFEQAPEASLIGQAGPPFSLAPFTVTSWPGWGCQGGVGGGHGTVHSLGSIFYS